ncbi:MAG: Uma2 family endonuclease [Isosphaeraceae bacterium]
MSVLANEKLVTTEELLALPEDGVDRELIRGSLRERPMTRRNRWHSRVETVIARLLDVWLDEQPEPRGEVVSGEAGFQLSRDPDTAVGIDVAYVPAEIVSKSVDRTYFEGPPRLAVEILSPSDTQEQIDEKVELYLEIGVAVVWVVNPRLRTVTVYRADTPPAVFTGGQELMAEPHLPGFRTTVARIFGERAP